MTKLLDRIFFWRRREEEKKCKKELHLALVRYENGTSGEIERIKSEIASLKEDVHRRSSPDFHRKAVGDGT